MATDITVRYIRGRMLKKVEELLSETSNPDLEGLTIELTELVESYRELVTPAVVVSRVNLPAEEVEQLCAQVNGMFQAGHLVAVDSCADDAAKRFAMGQRERAMLNKLSTVLGVDADWPSVQTRVLDLLKLEYERG